MAGRFSQDQWDDIEKKLAKDPAAYGMPDGGREESVVLASFNIRKLSRFKGRERELKFMARFCARCDLVAIQEVQDNTAGLNYLKDRVDERVDSAGEFGLVVSDVTGKTPGKRGMGERMAFLYRKSRVRWNHMASDLTVDRSGVIQMFEENEAEFRKTWSDYEAKLKKYAQTNKGSKPSLVLPAFLTFTRTPHVAAFDILGAGTAKPISFVAVNAHLIYGAMKERRAEFRELARWMAMRLKAEENMVAPNFILLGDLNMDMNNFDTDHGRVSRYMGDLKDEAFGDQSSPRIYFPFLGKHPSTGKPVLTNARHNQTFDQIGFFLGKNEGKLPKVGAANKIKGGEEDGFNYGVFDFAELFTEALKKKSFIAMAKDEKAAFAKNFEHSVSDHMPIWVRIPRPGF